MNRLYPMMACLMVSSSVWAVHTSVDIYVDTASVGGDGTTPALSGANAAYASLSVAEAAQDIDLVAADKDLTFHCARSAGGGEAASVTFADWVTSATCFIAIHSDDFPANGKWSDTAFVLHNNDAATSGIGVQEDFVRIDRMQIKVTSSSTNTRYGVGVAAIAADNDIRVTNCLIQGVPTGTGISHAVNVNDAEAVVSISNVVSYGFYIASDTGFIGFCNTNGTMNLYNCVSYGNTVGVTRSAGTVTVSNSAIANNTDDWSGTITADYCASDDADATTYTNGIDWASEASDWNAAWTSPSTGDFTVKNASSDLYDAGLADPGGANQPDTDIIGTARPQGAAWDIGAYEYIPTDINAWWARRRQ